MHAAVVTVAVSAASVVVANVASAVGTSAAGAPVVPAPIPYDPANDLGTMNNVTKLIGAEALWRCGITGQGIDVALIDTGVAPVEGIGTTINGPDLSFDLQTGAPASIDAYGHGTHLASLINGHDVGWAPPKNTCALGEIAPTVAKLLGLRTVPLTAEPPATGAFNDGAVFSGVAPGARLVNVKVGAADGAVDVTQVIAAINWVVENRARNGLNIKVLNLSFGTDGVQDWQVDPLSHAVERAWDSGITVMVSAGNDGTTVPTLANPAINKNVIAVGAMTFNGSRNAADWAVADFASRGDADRGIDIVMPGVSIAGLRVPGSFAATMYPTALVGDRYIRASGTSQAAAIASGMAALMLSAKPDLKPIDVKRLFAGLGSPVKGKSEAQGAGAVDPKRLGMQLISSLASAIQIEEHGTTKGTGTLAGARGTAVLELGGVTLDRETDVMGKPWKAAAWAKAVTGLKSWNGGLWRTWRWSGGWKGTTWANASWTAPAWNGTPWAALGIPTDTWADPTVGVAAAITDTADGWSGVRWKDAGWSGVRWKSAMDESGTWQGARWKGARWKDGAWAGAHWSSGSWR